MRILFHTFSFPPKVDGVTSRVLNTLRALHRRGHTLCVTTPQDPIAIPDWMTGAGIPVRPIRGMRLPLYREQFIGNPLHPGLWWDALCRILAFAPELVHLVGPDPGHWALMAICTALRIPVVASYHTDVLSFARRYGVPAAAVRALESGYDWSWIARVIATSPSFAQVLRTQHGIRCDAVWPPGVDGEIFQPQPADPALRHRLTNGRPDRTLLIYAGRFAREKDVPALLRYVEPFPDVALALIGDGPERGFDPHGLGDRLFVSQGFWTQRQVAAAYACADAFITASCTETCGFAVLEAMACGLPILAPAAQGLVDLVTDGEQGLLFAPGDTAAARTTLARFLGDAHLAAQLRERAHQHARTLTWDAATRFIEDLYRQVLAEAQATGRDAPRRRTR